MQTADWERRLRAVFFDMEGTLVGFEWLLEEGQAALRHELTRLGFPEGTFDQDTYATMWNRALRDPDAPVDEAGLRRHLGPVYDRYDLDALSRWTLRTGAAECVEVLRRGGFAVGVVSNVGRRALTPALEKLGLGDAFDLVLSRDDVRFMKPEGEGLRRALAHFQLTPQDALFVGDSRTDVLAARDVGVKVAIVTGGESDQRALSIDPPDFVIASLADVVSLVA
ncbi:MAG: HAD family hydrolase [Thermoleophilia bacterium]